jgi:uncharacterized membrane protein
VSQDRTEIQEVGIDRLLTLSDGVFAIALTLLVLDLHQPNVTHGLRHAVLAQWPQYLSYALSFLIIGIIWAQHHLGYRYIRHTDHVFILLNILFLMWVAAVPFPTALLARYLENPSERQTAIAIYTGLFLVGGLLVNLTWLYASHDRRLLDDAISPAKVRKLTQNYLPGPILYFIAFVLAFVAPLASVILIVLINLFYAVSPLLGHWLGSRRHVRAGPNRATRTG